MSENTKTTIQSLKEFVFLSKEIDDQQKQQYSEYLEKIETANLGEDDASIAESFEQFMDKELFKMENIAIDSKNPELINLFAELREARDLLNQNILLVDKDKISQ